MKLPLLFQYKPNVGIGPTVMLAQGSYRIEGNHKDSDLKLLLSSDLVPLDCVENLEFKLDSDERAKISITRKGTEPELTVWAVKL